QLREPLLLPAHRHANLNRGSTQIREEPGERVGLARLGRNDDLGWHAGSTAVVLETERLEHGRRVVTLGVFEMKGVAVDQPAVAQREYLHRGAAAVRRPPDHAHGADIP